MDKLIKRYTLVQNNELFYNRSGGLSWEDFDIAAEIAEDYFNKGEKNIGIAQFWCKPASFDPVKPVNVDKNGTIFCPIVWGIE